MIMINFPIDGDVVFDVVVWFVGAAGIDFCHFFTRNL